ncbi:transposable element Tcb2 transposase [Trichonephila clavipes]|nr:transposable element Tcb2 transposase [Trichonephila clavipes]
MSSRHHIDDFMRGRIIGKIEEGRKITDVAREFDTAHSVVSRLWKSFKTTGMCSRRHGGGRVRRKQISRKTVARRLRGGGLYARRPVVCVPLTRQHRTARLQWCREHYNWTEQDWACVLFSDEKNIQEKDRYPTCSIMVWAGIMINGRTRLHVVANGTMTGQRYIDGVLLPHVRLFRGAVGDKFVFMDDNATFHRTLAVQYCLDSEGIQCLVGPARSPDLNPIENVWDALGRQVARRNYPPTNKNTLIRALTEEWDKLPQQLLDNVVQSMRIVWTVTDCSLRPKSCYDRYHQQLQQRLHPQPVGGCLVRDLRLPVAGETAAAETLEQPSKIEETAEPTHEEKTVQATPEIASTETENEDSEDDDSEHTEGLRYPSGQGIGSWQACHELEPSTTKDPSCRATIVVGNTSIQRVTRLLSLSLGCSRPFNTAAPLSICTKEETRTAIRFLFEEGVKPSEIILHMQVQYRDVYREERIDRTLQTGKNFM